MADDWITIGSDALTARVNPLGAELSSITDASGAEWMTDADPAYWTGRAPVLFPVVGAPAGGTIRVDGRAYPMGKHGFARRRRFAVEAAGAARAVFLLTDDAETQGSYPFAFELRLIFEAAGASLSVTAEIRNPDAHRPLPASLGFHPAFAWPLPGGGAKTQARVLFAEAEPDGVREIAEDGTVAPGILPSPLVEGGRLLPLRDELFAHDALVWDQVRSRELVYGAPNGPSLRLTHDAPMLGIWTKPGAAFLCLEPWHGIADPSGYNGEYATKPGVFHVEHDVPWRTTMTITLEP